MESIRLDFMIRVEQRNSGYEDRKVQNLAAVHSSTLNIVIF